ncbi:putative thiol-specific antioxidant [Fusarium fujikuroi]|nr:putative thiol-specific antioxidant [Fusarium fujikuroi]
MSSAFVQRPAPDFSATTLFPGGEFRDIKLSDFKGQWVVLLFYPMDFTFVCPTEIIQYNNALDRFREINTTGVLRQITVNDLPVGRDVEETIRLVKAFQFTDEYGEVCPAGWQEGGKTMKADPKGSLEYFNEQGENGAKA